MQIPAFSRSRLSPAILAVAGLVATAGVVSLSAARPAHAESGRRICRYDWNQSVGNPQGRLVSFVVNYKKKGACPNVDYHKVSLPEGVGSWMPSPDTWEKAPVPKITCEEFQSLLTLPGNADGRDVCTYLPEDTLWAVTSSLPGDTNSSDRFFRLGNVWTLG